MASCVPLRDDFLIRPSCYLRGAWTDADDRRTLEVRNPASGALIGTVPRMGAAECRRAIEAAEGALPAWRARTARERAAILRRWHALILENQEDLATLLTAEQGKPLAEARAEVACAAGVVEWFAEEARRIQGDLLPGAGADRRVLVRREPVGVVAVITPCPFPAAAVARRAAPALAAGCTVVLKPASATPCSALALAELGERAGLPAGVLNVITGDAGAIGAELATSPRVKKLAFTGSAEVGRRLLALAAAAPKEVALELGGGAPFLVFDDADLEAAVAAAVASAFRSGGPACVAIDRILVQDAVYEPFARSLAEAVGRLEVGDGLRAATQQGPLIDQRSVERIEAQVADAVAKGARVVAGGRRHALGGNFFEPTVIADATPEMAVARAAAPGPVAPLLRFRTEAEALRLANATEAGRAACFFTRDLNRAFRVSEALAFGIVGLNAGLSAELGPPGGAREPGVGREGSRHGIEDYLTTKVVCVGGVA